MKTEKQVKTITLGLVLSWIFTITFFLLTLENIFIKHYFIGFLFLLIGLILFPPLNKYFKEQLKFELSKGLKITIIIILVIIIIVIIPKNSNKNNIINDTSKTIKYIPITNSISKEQIIEKSQDKNIQNGHFYQNPEDIFPNPNKIPTEYTISEIMPANESFEKYTGFKIRKMIQYLQRTGLGANVIRIYSSKFQDNNNTLIIYNSIIIDIKNKRGYSSFDINEPENICFSYYKEYGLSDGVYIICHKDNLIIEWSIASSDYYSKDMANKFKKIVFNND